MDVTEFMTRGQNFFRRRRMRIFTSTFDINDATRIIDLGGLPLTWSLIDQRPEVTMINIEDGVGVDAQRDHLDPIKHRMVIYDGRTVPFPDRSFDVCYSNSVIEHVGDAAAVSHFASEVRRLAPRYFVQTPNRWFFMEPHFVAPFIHWLPVSFQRRWVLYFSFWCWVNKADQAKVDEMLHDIRLLTVAEMRELFPDAEIIRERVLGMTKSIIAVKR